MSVSIKGILVLFLTNFKETQYKFKRREWEGMSILGYIPLVTVGIAQLYIGVKTFKQVKGIKLDAKTDKLRVSPQELLVGLWITLPFVAFTMFRVVMSLILQMTVMFKTADWMLDSYLQSSLVLIGVLTLSTVVIAVCGLVRSIRNKSILVGLLSLVSLLAVFDNGLILSVAVLGVGLVVVLSVVKRSVH